MKKPLVVAGLLSVTSIAVAVWLLYVRYISMPSVEVSDVRQVETLVLGNEKGNPHTHGITVRGSGEIDGQATISLMLGGQAYKVERLSGKVEFEWGGDWYSETAEIRYEPENVRSGKVVLTYRFHQ